MNYVTAPRRVQGYRRSCFFIPQTGEGLSSFPLAYFFARLTGPRLRRLGPPALVLALLGALPGCGSRDVVPSQTPPVLVLAVDGLEWDVLGPLVAAGEMPQFEQLMRQGRFGLLETTRPTFSPIIWTSIATGKPAPEHGIRGFVRRRRVSGEKGRLYNSHDRRTKAFWNILSDYGRSAAVVGWWMTYPAEAIDGVMVAQVNTLDQVRRRGGEAIIKGGLQSDLADQVYPESRAVEVLAIHDEVIEELPDRLRTIFGDLPEPRSPLTERLWQNTLWAFRADAAYVEIAAALAAEGHDLVACYLGGADVTGHRFWRYMQPEAFAQAPTQEEIAAFGDVIPDYYRFVDQALGRLRAAMPDATNVLVVTDHGMGPVNRDAEFDAEDLPEDVNSGHHHGAKAGVMVAAGPTIEAGHEFGKSWAKEDLPVLASVFDITPTILSLLGVPPGDDMEGGVMAGISDALGETVTTHDSPEWLAARAETQSREVEQDPERMKQLRALGYIN